MGVSYQWCDRHWYEYRCYKGKVYYYRMQILIRECQSIWALADILLTDYFVWLCSYLNPYTCDGWGGYVLCWYLIDWDALSSPLLEIILCTCIDMRLSISWARGDRPCWGWWDVKIIIWARGDRPCGICLIYDSALRSSAQTRGDRPCRYMDLASPPWVMNSRCISEEYHVYTVERVLGILRHIISWCHIALHLITSFIIVDYVLYWWLYIMWSLIILILMKLDW